MRGWVGIVVSMSLPWATGGAAPWDFSEPIDVTRVQGERVFHHLGSGGRHGIAVSGSRVAVVWEDNRDRLSRCYLAIGEAQKGGFSGEYLLSGEEPCYEPAVAGLGSGRFAAAWEEAGRVWVRTLEIGGLNPRARVAGPGAAQAALAPVVGGGFLAAWSQAAGGRTRIWIAELGAPEADAAPVLLRAHPIEQGAPDGDQNYPSLAVLADGRAFAGWEDRRKGHTVILATLSRDGLTFAPPTQINESFWGGRELGYGRGTGAMRLSLAPLPNGAAIAVWADKRDFRSGYDVYAAWRQAGGADRDFGPNQKVQDGFGDGVAQWHPTVTAAAAAPPVVVAWDDDREGSPDIWISWPEEAGWSDDLDLPGASGPGVQVEPAVAMDTQGNLHIAWVNREDLNAPSRIRYLLGRRKAMTE